MIWYDGKIKFRNSDSEESIWVIPVILNTCSMLFSKKKTIYLQVNQLRSSKQLWDYLLLICPFFATRTNPTLKFKQWLVTRCSKSAFFFSCHASFIYLRGCCKPQTDGHIYLCKWHRSIVFVTFESSSTLYIYQFYSGREKFHAGLPFQVSLVTSALFFVSLFFICWFS